PSNFTSRRSRSQLSLSSSSTSLIDGSRLVVRKAALSTGSVVIKPTMVRRYVSKSASPPSSTLKAIYGLCSATFRYAVADAFAGTPYQTATAVISPMTSPSATPNAQRRRNECSSQKGSKPTVRISGGAGGPPNQEKELASCAPLP